MRNLFSHSIASGGNIQYVFRLRAFRIGHPVFPVLAIAAFAEIARFRLRMAGVLQSVRAIGNSDIVDVERKFFALAKMDDAFV